MKRSRLSFPLLLVLITLSCGNREKPVRISSAGIDAPRDGKTPVEILENYALAYGDRDIELYKTLIDPGFELRVPAGLESYNDGGGTGYEKEITSTEAMFASAAWIRYDFTVDPSRPSRVDGYPASRGFLEIVVRDIDCRIWPEGWEDTVRVMDDSVLFVLMPDRLKTPPTWRIVCQQLFTGGEGCAVEPVE